MSETTLTTKQVEDGFAYEPEYEYSNPTDTGYVERNRRAFRKWHAAELRKERVKTLREFADDPDVYSPEVEGESSDFDRGNNHGADYLMGLARARADEMEGEQG